MKLVLKKKRPLSLILILALVLSFVPADTVDSTAKTRRYQGTAAAADADMKETDIPYDPWGGYDPWGEYDPYASYDPYYPYDPYSPYDPWTTEYPWLTEEPEPTEEPALTPVPTSTPEPATTAAPTDSSASKPKTKEQKVLKKILKQKKKYPDGTPWDNSVCYSWKALGYNLTGCGCVAFACKMSDAGFGKKKKAKEIMDPSPKKIRIGDILRLNGDTHSVIVIGRKGKYFTIAEGNMNNAVYWGRKISKKQPIDYVWTRW